MNSAHRIDATTLRPRPRPMTGQHYTSTEDLAAYAKGSDPINISRKAVALEGVTSYYAERRHLVLCWKAAPRTMLEGGISYYAGRRHLVP